MKFMNSGKVLLATFTGALIGILVAPDKGSKTRKKLSEKTNGYFKELRSDFNKLLKNINKKMEATKEEIEDLSKKGKARAKETGEEIKENVKKATRNQT